MLFGRISKADPRARLQKKGERNMTRLRSLRRGILTVSAVMIAFPVFCEAPADSAKAGERGPGTFRAGDTQGFQEGNAIMTEEETERFVKDYEAAWASREPGIMSTMWHADGILIHPLLANEPISGDLVPFNNDRTKHLNPDLTWTLLDWTSRGNRVVLEWENKLTVAGQPVTLRGVDVMTLREGKIEKEIVYMDTMEIWQRLDPAMKRGPMLPAEALREAAAKARGAAPE
jgi:hypothetical protein